MMARCTKSQCNPLDPHPKTLNPGPQDLRPHILKPRFSQLDSEIKGPDTGMGLCLAKETQDWLNCKFCRNRWRKVLCFQGHDQVQGHFSNLHLGEVAVLDEPGSTSLGGRGKITATRGPGKTTAADDRGTFGCLG